MNSNVVIHDLHSEIRTGQKTEKAKFELITGWRFILIRIKLIMSLILLIFKETTSWKEFRIASRHVFSFSKNNLGNATKTNYIKLKGQYYWSIYSAPWPSQALEKEVLKEIKYGLDPSPMNDPLHLVFFSITKKCPLQCEHCFEWNIMHKPETLSRHQIFDILEKLEQKDLSSIYLTGGEPLSRYEDLIAIIKRASRKMNVWLFTSGYGLDQNRANQLKNAGLTGILISIDHYEPNKHNAFRGNENAFKKATNAAVFARNAGLLTALSLCVTKSFLSTKNLLSYMEFAKGLNVGFVQFLDAREKGRYANKKVALNQEEIDLLINFQRSFNSNPKNSSYPSIIYGGYFQKNYGCNAGGHRYLYIDSDANIQSCPFCEIPLGNALNTPFQYRKGSCAIGKIAQL